MANPINVTMIKDHGLSCSFQVYSWEKVYEKIKEEQACELNKQRYVIAYASEIEWDKHQGVYDIVKSETFVDSVAGLKSMGPDIRIVSVGGKPKQWLRR
jgi:intein-encoded DNA endonuclease-like protein